MERTLPSQDVFSYALIVLHIHKIFLKDSEHILVPHITLVDLLTLCQPCELKLFSHLGGFEPLSLAPKAIVLPIKLSSDIERYDYTSFFLPKVSLILSLIFSKKYLTGLYEYL